MWLCYLVVRQGCRLYVFLRFCQRGCHEEQFTQLQLLPPHPHADGKSECVFIHKTFLELCSATATPEHLGPQCAGRRQPNQLERSKRITLLMRQSRLGGGGRHLREDLGQQGLYSELDR